MAMFVVLALAVLAGVAQAAVPSTRAHATVEEYPSVVQVEFKSVASSIWGHACAGHILTSSFILSAAQCFSGLNYDPQNRRIRAGSSNLNTGGVIVYVTRAYNHPTFGIRDNEGDISVVRLIGQLEFSSLIAAGPIVAQGFQYPENRAVVHLGWGHVEAGQSSSEVLLETTVYTVDNEWCENLYEGIFPFPEYVSQNMICVRRTRGVVDNTTACMGDTGGPLYHKEDQRNIAIGVVSWGILACTNDLFPTVTTSVSSYTDWIVQTAA